MKQDKTMHITDDALMNFKKKSLAIQDRLPRHKRFKNASDALNYLITNCPFPKRENK